MILFARALPAMRERVERRPGARTAWTRERVLACAVRLLDRGFFRVGGEDYAVENETYGLATMQQGARDASTAARSPSTTRPRAASAGCSASSSPRSHEVVAALSAAAAAVDELLAFKRRARRWVDVRSDDINAYVKEVTGGDFSAKDFRTWNATVLAAVVLAVSGLVARLQDRAQAGDRRAP